VSTASFLIALIAIIVVAKAFENEVHEVAQFFVPIFFVSVGAAVDLRSMNARVVLIGVVLTLVGMLARSLPDSRLGAGCGGWSSAWG